MLSIALFSITSTASYHDSAKLRPNAALPKLRELSQNLGIPAHKLRQELGHLNAQINGKTPASQSCRNSPFRYCSLLMYLENYEKTPSAQKKNLRQYYKGTRPYIGNLKALQANDYSYLSRKFTGFSKPSAYRWMQAALRSKACPQNLSAALIRLAEEHLPDPQAIYYMEKLYEHSNRCLSPQDPHYEEVHMRQSLLRFLWGSTKLARSSALRADLAQYKKRPDQVLYWNGLLQEKKKTKKIFWRRLVKDYPLSYYTLEVWNHSNIDPYQYFRKKRGDIRPSRIVRQKKHLAQKGIYWVEALFHEGYSTAAKNLSMELSEKFSGTFSPENIYYLALLKADTFSFLSASPYIKRYFKDNFHNISIPAIQVMYPVPFQHVFHRYKNIVDPYLLYAVARQESAFNPRAKSPANAQGLLQLLPQTARQLNRNRSANLYDPRTNVRLGAKFLNQLIHRYDGIVPALAAYNAGPNRINTWKKRFPTEDPILFMDLIPFKETHNYVKSILSNHYWYENIYKGKKSVVPASKKI